MLTSERLSEILQRWFISEPPMFGVLSLHETRENRGMTYVLNGQVYQKPNGMLDSEINNQLRTPRLCFLLNIHIGEMSPD